MAKATTCDQGAHRVGDGQPYRTRILRCFCWPT